MANYVEKFFGFLESHSSKFANTEVSVITLQEDLMTFTPMALKFSEPDTVFERIPSVLIMNLCKYGDKYELDILNVVKRILLKDITEDDCKLQLTFLVHLTKTIIPKNRMAGLYRSIEYMTSNIEVTHQLLTWKNVAILVLNHPQVNEVINRSIKSVFGIESAKINETGKIPVTVKFFESEELQLRGFSGVNQVFINGKHFQMRILQQSQKLSTAHKETAVLVDIATVALHEYSHVRIRQIMDDLNMSTPQFYTATASSSHSGSVDPEFGRIVERNIFRAAVDWPESIRKELVSLQYVEDFLKSIENGTTLPILDNNVSLIEREGLTVMSGGSGADFALLSGSLW